MGLVTGLDYEQSRWFKFDVLCEMLELSDKKSKVLKELVKNPYHTHQEIADRLGLPRATEQHIVDYLFYKLNVKNKIQLRDKIVYLIS